MLSGEVGGGELKLKTYELSSGRSLLRSTAFGARSCWKRVRPEASAGAGVGVAAGGGVVVVVLGVEYGAARAVARKEAIRNAVEVYIIVEL